MDSHEPVSLCPFSKHSSRPPDSIPHSFECFALSIDPAWIEEALTLTGTVSLRHRRLPAERIVSSGWSSGWPCSGTSPAG
ncbi:transposase domain-containing protein [Azotobacter sp. CWF10]